MIRVHVTKKHIADGWTYKSTRCPIALALRELFPEERIMVCDHYMRFENDQDPDDPIFLRLPVEVHHFIFNFDDGRTVEPFSFNLPIS